MPAKRHSSGQDKASGLELELDDVVEVGLRGRQTARAAGALLTVAVVLTALNMRPAITSVGPLLDQARSSLGASQTWPGCSPPSPSCALPSPARLLPPWFAVPG